MNQINLTDFQFLTTTHGKEDGQAYFDPNESLIHYIFPDRITISTDLVDYRTYEVSILDQEIQVIKTRLDDYRLHMKAKEIEDAMDSDDWEELSRLWQQMIINMITAVNLKDLNIREELGELFTYLFEEDEAENFFQKLPMETKPTSMWIWEQVSKALEQANFLAEFEWKEWVELGVSAVNGLSPLQQKAIRIPYPSKKEIKAVNNAPDWERALLGLVRE